MGSAAGEVFLQACDEHQKLELGQLFGGLFMSSWLAFYFQLTEEQMSVLP